MGLYTTKKASILNLGIFNQVNDKYKIALAADYALDKNAQSLTMGVNYQIDSFTTIAGKIDSNSILSLGFAQKLNKSINLSFSSQVDMKEWAGDSHRFGMVLDITPND